MKKLVCFKKIKKSLRKVLKFFCEIEALPIAAKIRSGKQRSIIGLGAECLKRPDFYEKQLKKDINKCIQEAIEAMLQRFPLE